MHPPDELKVVPVGITEVGQPWSSQDLRETKTRVFSLFVFISIIIIIIIIIISERIFINR
jgi:hypothetical protein